MRQIALDTETTGLSTEQGHRIIEIGCVEFIDRKLTGNNFHCYINPEREIDAGALAIHGLSIEFLRDKPAFAELIDPLLHYITGAELVIHNAVFDVGFLNYELTLAGRSQAIQDCASVFDTLPFARQRHPGQKNSLDALCKRYSIDNTHRQLHGALLDAELLARVYLAMTGGQGSLFVDQQTVSAEKHNEILQSIIINKPLPIMQLTEDEEKAHADFLEMLKKSSGSASLWEE